MNLKGLLKTNSWLRNMRITGGAFVIDTYRAGSVPLPLKCWYDVFSGITSRLPAAHSKVALLSFAQPHARRAAAGNDVHDLFVHVALGLRLPAGLDLHEVRVVRQHRVRDVDHRALAALALPVAELDVAQVLELVLDDALDALALDPIEVRIARPPTYPSCRGLPPSRRSTTGHLSLLSIVFVGRFAPLYHVCIQPRST